jgi:hypothetical protein
MEFLLGSCVKVASSPVLIKDLYFPTGLITPEPTFPAFCCNLISTVTDRAIASTSDADFAIAAGCTKAIEVPIRAAVKNKEERDIEPATW